MSSLNLLRSFRSQAFPELAQRGTLHKMGLFRRNATENHPHHILVEPLNHLLIRQVGPMWKSHEADHQPGRFGRTASAGTGVVRRQDRVDPFPVDLSGKHQQGVCSGSRCCCTTQEKRLGCGVGSCIIDRPLEEIVKIGTLSGGYYDIILKFNKYLRC